MSADQKWQLFAASIFASSILAVMAQHLSLVAYRKALGSGECVVHKEILPAGSTIYGLVGNRDNLGRATSCVFDPNNTHSLSQALATDATVNLDRQATSANAFSASELSAVATVSAFHTSLTVFIHALRGFYGSWSHRY